MFMGLKLECSVPVMVMMGPPRLSRPPERVRGGGRRGEGGEGERRNEERRTMEGEGRKKGEEGRDVYRREEMRRRPRNHI